MQYNWQQQDWPDFSYNLSEIEDFLFAFAEETGHIGGILKAVPEHVKVETLIDTMVYEAIKTSEIEGEFLSRQDVASSIRNNLGINKHPEPVKDKKAQGAAQLMVNARNAFADKLTEKKLFDWHKMLLNESKTINTGVWRKDQAPMQVVSGAIGKEKVHFEAPPSDRVQQEMDRFIQWFNETAPGGKQEIKKAPVRSAIAHLYFETIHPFEDGNGRIGRVLAEKALSQTLGRPVMLSLSRKIEADRKAYYKSLETAQRSNEITRWIIYFVKIILAAQIEAKELLDFTLHKTRFFDHFKNTFNDRQLKAVKKMLAAGPEGFEGGMTAQKYISITKASKATATRDLQDLLESGCLKVTGGGRSTHYVLNLNNEFIEI
ncbi:Fic family protein [Dyadobacter arcticus]|uniref:Fic family protein n=1 Tax=Dyadobacter arcticus TaxID=1078754 RepID=A0ABX0UJV9_9BACT|nr:Fic family protein [Dyadobacter arcticus]NIJ52768.1 Fic family protein [Dyadobacter arcticus]